MDLLTVFKSIPLKSIMLTSVLTFIACSKPNSAYNGTSDALYAANPANMKILLTDAPNPNLNRVVVNIKHVELWFEKNGIQKRMLVAKGLGPVDLLKLQNGKVLGLHEFDVDFDGLHLTKMRLILEEDGHFSEKSDGTICQMKTPSAEMTGIKIQLPESILIERDHSYSVVMDFDAMKSVVLQGNGGCLLKPVFHMKKATRAPRESIGDDGNVRDDDRDKEQDCLHNNQPVVVTPAPTPAPTPTPAPVPDPAPAPVPDPTTTTQIGLDTTSPTGFDTTPVAITDTTPIVVGIQETSFVVLP